MKPILNSKNNLVAYEHDVTSNRSEIRSKSNGLLAWHDKKLDRTFDRSGRNVGTGDQRGKFIPNN